MGKFFLKKIILYPTFVLFLFLIDRASKLYILSVLESTGNVDININSYINLILVWNTGIGFGLLSFNQAEIYNLLTILISSINLIIVYLIFKLKDIRVYFFIIILGGSLGNLFDRIYYSAVLDFIDISYKNYHWFIFNVADIFISLGVIFMILSEFFVNKIEDHEKY